MNSKVSLLLRRIVIRVWDMLYYGVRPLLGPRGVCRFSPTCGEYTRQALAKYGIIKGVELSVVRICKCHPFHPGGSDPLP